MAYLFNTVYLLLLLLASPALLYRACTQGKYRTGLWTRLTGRVPWRDHARPALWLHGVSLGEVNLLAPLVAELSRRRPDCDLCISTSTVAGYTAARQRYPQLMVFYAPLDFSWAVRTALARIRPEQLILAELELWPNWIRAAHRAGIRVMIVNGRLSDRSFARYLHIRPWLARLFALIDGIIAQNETYADRFRRLGAPPSRVHTSGSLKFDGATTDRTQPHTRQLATLARIAPTDHVFLAGSTQHPEESLALEVFRRLQATHPRLRLILVPRHPHRFHEVAQLLAASGLAWQRRSELSTTASATPARILLVDTVGELAAWWGTAHTAFVGGSLGSRGGQNMIEPAGYGAAIAFGPNTRNFHDIVAALLEHQAAVVVHNVDEWTDFLRRTLDDPAYAADLGQRARALVLRQQGATARTADWLLGPASPQAIRAA